VIASLRGRLLVGDRDGLVVEVGGVGLRVHATSAASRLATTSPDDVFLQTHLVVREDALALFGFATETERALFVELLSVNGVGPKAALAILSAYSPERLRTALATEDATLLTSVPGIGKKLATRIVVELRERVGAAGLAASNGAGANGSAPPDALSTARDALLGLGYTVAEAESALTATTGEAEDRLRQALARLGAPE
jgi:Holliday junction DNA helicase RuvA